MINIKLSQTMWETWFVSATTIFLAYIFIGMLEGSKTMFPNWCYFASLSCINFLYCLYVGTKPREFKIKSNI